MRHNNIVEVVRCTMRWAGVTSTKKDFGVVAALQRGRCVVCLGQQNVHGGRICHPPCGAHLPLAVADTAGATAAHQESMPSVHSTVLRASDSTPSTSRHSDDWASPSKAYCPKLQTSMCFAVTASSPRALRAVGDLQS
jgi:hypothetical protein